MSSAHRIIVARHDETGRIQLPLGGMTCYGTDLEGEAKLLEHVRQMFDEKWTLSFYAPDGAFFAGGKG